METPWHTMDADEAIRQLKSSRDGLSDSDARSRLERYGCNEIIKEKGISRLAVFVSQFKSVLVLILIAATAFSALIGEVIDAVAILVIILLNGVLGYKQEYKAEKTIEALRNLTKPEAVVMRHGRMQKIPSRELVPGDVVLLEDGSRIPADMRIIEENNMKIDESSITGESVPVAVTAEKLGDVRLPERKNMAWSGTLVTYGRGKGVVVSTGMNTQMGRIAHLVTERAEEITPLQKNLGSFGKSLGIIILGICVLVIIVGIIRAGMLSGVFPGQEVVVNTIITGIALAVAAIPEGLPAVVTITLALGLQRLAKHNALIRKLPAVEALGSTTVICADKTGTLTKNEMTVKEIWMPGMDIQVTGEGYEPVGRFMSGEKEMKTGADSADPLSYLLRAGALCVNARTERKQTKAGGRWEIIGDPTEGAIAVAAEKAGITSGILEKRFERINEIPFSSERKMMTTVNRMKNGKLLVCAKGAPESLLRICSSVMENGSGKPINETLKRTILLHNKRMADDALRVLAVACKEVSANAAKEPESGLAFLGLMGMKDPPREEVKDDIAVCRQAGIKVVMITGDHLHTAVAIAREIGLMEGEDSKALSGEQLEEMTSTELEIIVESVSVYARVNPEHKLKIIEALRKKGHIIAMTGDGVNDAPALKGADIGIAMGINGTDVAKEASDMVLRDDNFSSIIKAVRGGRAIYDNIRKFIHYLLSSNLSEVLIVLLAMLIGLGYYASSEAGGLVFIPVLGAIQLLWINILTDMFPALALGVDPPSPGIMQRKPRNPREKILDKKAVADIFVVGIVLAICTLFLFWFNLPKGGAMAATVAMTTLVVFELARAQSVRWKYGISLFSNKKLILAILISILLQLAAIYIPYLQPVFNTVPIGIVEWAEIIGITLAVMTILWIREKTRKDLC